MKLFKAFEILFLNLFIFNFINCMHRVLPITDDDACAEVVIEIYERDYSQHYDKNLRVLEMNHLTERDFLSELPDIWEFCNKNNVRELHCNKINCSENLFREVIEPFNACEALYCIYFSDEIILLKSDYLLAYYKKSTAMLGKSAKLSTKQSKLYSEESVTGPTLIAAGWAFGFLPSLLYSISRLL